MRFMVPCLPPKIVEVAKVYGLNFDGGKIRNWAADFSRRWENSPFPNGQQRLPIEVFLGNRLITTGAGYALAANLADFIAIPLRWRNNSQQVRGLTGNFT
ncbi:MAG TPA: hypothetical protein PLD20_10475 [Blastocatellia bacterium]|nr:hypothetical protein [Blastocatellia bacterium]HMV85229.1 hypothetical protein [Blastocatellia bacterium]HMX29650.1 hypothetical protein [Blastocatellia bacterium]HMY74594.1 hypothetical protein [Blastocatellia bacterium]HMZ18344.1 hypothetical protein [Blastocatellia bacterium]